MCIWWRNRTSPADEGIFISDGIRTAGVPAGVALEVTAFDGAGFEGAAPEGEPAERRTTTVAAARQYLIMTTSFSIFEREAAASRLASI